MEFASGIAVVILMSVGSFFYVVGALGLVRMPDLFTRIHAASVVETLGAGLMLVGMMFAAGWSLDTAKLAIILGILLYSGPVATHALAQAALTAGVVPRLAEDRTKRKMKAVRRRPAHRYSGIETRRAVIEALINMCLLTLLAIVTIGVVRLRNLFAVVILSGIYSFLMASVLIVLDAVDVAMTEASVGAGISTVLMLGVLSLTKTEEIRPAHSPLLPLFVALVTAGALIYGTLDLPDFGAADTPVHRHVGPYYLENSIPQTGVPNVVTSVLSSYRGYDTLGETTVIFTAGIAVLLLLKGRGKRKSKKGKSA